MSGLELQQQLVRNERIRVTLGAVAVLFAVLLIPMHGAQSQSQSSQSDSLSSSQLRKQLSDVELQIRSQQRRLQKLKSEHAAIGKRLSELEAAQETTLSEQSALQESVLRLSTEGERLKLTLYGARQQMEHQRARMHRRLVALYKTSKQSPNADYLIRANSTTDLLKRAKYLSRVTEHDQEYISQLSEVVRRGRGDRKRLEELLVERRAKLAKLTELSEQLAQQKFQTASLLREQEAKAQQQESSLVALRLSAKQLQNMLGEVMDSAGVQGEDSSEEPRGVGLARVKGRLEFPVNGQLVQGFGKQRHTEFEDILFKKGLEIAAQEGVEVRAVEAGKVILRQDLPGYGQVIIIDHGQRYYTLYGRLGAYSVGLGEEVVKGQVVAQTGSLDAQGSNFYFELRYRGKAKNPNSYFKKLPKTA